MLKSFDTRNSTIPGDIMLMSIPIKSSGLLMYAHFFSLLFFFFFFFSSFFVLKIHPFSFSFFSFLFFLFVFVDYITSKVVRSLSTNRPSPIRFIICRTQSSAGIFLLLLCFFWLSFSIDRLQVASQPRSRIQTSPTDPLFFLDLGPQSSSPPQEFPRLLLADHAADL